MQLSDGATFFEITCVSERNGHCTFGSSDYKNPMAIGFSKYEGIGNDFIIVDGTPEIKEFLTSERVRLLCNRHTGVGADGLLIVGADPPSMQLINQDGSRAEMSGNGIRCVVAHLYRKGVISLNNSISIQTEAGPHLCKVIEDLPHIQVTVQMQVPEFRAGQVPFTGIEHNQEFIDTSFLVDGDAYTATILSMGNPHIVLFDVPEDRIQFLGKRIELDSRFPQRVNVEFAHVEENDALSLIVWERGAGFTKACGTGACAAAVAAVKTGRLPRNQPIFVDLPGGRLVVQVNQMHEPVEMTGPVRHVFDGKSFIKFENE